MQIVQTSKMTLENLYSTLMEDEKATTLVLNINMTTYAEKLGISKEQLNLCLWYLNEAGYVKCRHPEYNRDENASKEIILTPASINLVENISL